MKFFALILAVIVFTLSCIPCMDGAYALGNGKAEIKNSKSENQQQHKETDACSPFCTCNCCAGFTFLLSSIKVQPIVHVSEKIYSSYFSSSATAISLAIWQPPQLS